jgi:hypothetical protein
MLTGFEMSTERVWNVAFDQLPSGKETMLETRSNRAAHRGTRAMIVLRLVHVLCGVFWAGTVLFVVTFLEPSVRAAGPDGAKVMQAMLKRHYLTAMPLVAGLTILSGLDLLRRVSDGFSPAWFASRPGITLTAGSVASLIAFGIGILIMRPANLQAGSLSQQAAAAQGPERESILSRAQVLRRRGTVSARWVAALLTLAVATMAVTRYVGAP